MSVSITTAAQVALLGVGTALTAYAIHLAVKTSYFKKVVVYKDSIGPFLAVYGNFVGPYSKAFCSDIPDKLKKAGYGYEDCDGFGLFFDAPKETKPEKCRSTVGSIVMQSSDLVALEAKRKEIENQPEIIETGLKVAIFEKSEAIMTKFTFFQNMLIMVAITKGYKALMQYSKENKLDESVLGTKGWQSSIEIYDCKNKLHFIGFPLTPRKELLKFEYSKEQ